MIGIIIKIYWFPWVENNLFQNKTWKLLSEVKIKSNQISNNKPENITTESLNHSQYLKPSSRGTYRHEAVYKGNSSMFFTQKCI